MQLYRRSLDREKSLPLFELGNRLPEVRPGVLGHLAEAIDREGAQLEKERIADGKSDDQTRCEWCAAVGRTNGSKAHDIVDGAEGCDENLRADQAAGPHELCRKVFGLAESPRREVGDEQKADRKKDGYQGAAQGIGEDGAQSTGIRDAREIGQSVLEEEGDDEAVEGELDQSENGAYDFSFHGLRLVAVSLPVQQEP